MKIGKFSREDLAKREQGCVQMLERFSINTFVEQEASEIYNILLPISSEATTELQGIPASSGKVTGRACVILDPARAGHFKEGDILITSMTRPEFTPLMKKAAAIITDEGGITSHASIISRELGKPCIIATKKSTQVFKDGMRLEVDAFTGIVRIIEK